MVCNDDSNTFLVAFVFWCLVVPRVSAAASPEPLLPTMGMYRKAIHVVLLLEPYAYTATTRVSLIP